MNFLFCKFVTLSYAILDKRMISQGPRALFDTLRFLHVFGEDFQMTNTAGNLCFNEDGFEAAATYVVTVEAGRAIGPVRTSLPLLLSSCCVLQLGFVFVGPSGPYPAVLASKVSCTLMTCRDISSHEFLVELDAVLPILFTTWSIALDAHDGCRCASLRPSPTVTGNALSVSTAAEADDCASVSGFPRNPCLVIADDFKRTQIKNISKLWYHERCCNAAYSKRDVSVQSRA
jgi:hypothetical protein